MDKNYGLNRILEWRRNKLQLMRDIFFLITENRVFSFHNIEFVMIVFFMKSDVPRNVVNFNN